jgi:hypothetical protein
MKRLLMMALMSSVCFGNDPAPGFEDLTVTGQTRSAEANAPLMPNNGVEATVLDSLAEDFHGGNAGAPVARPELPFRPDFEATISMDNVKYWTRWALETLQGTKKPIRMIRYHLTGKGVLVQVVADYSLVSAALQIPGSGLAYGPGQIFLSPDQRQAGPASRDNLCVMVSVEVELPGALRGSEPAPGAISVKPGAPEFRVFYEVDLQEYAGLMAEKGSLERQMHSANREQHRRITTRLMEVDEKIGNFDGTVLPVTATPALFRILAEALNSQKLFGDKITLSIVGDKFVVERIDAEILRFARVGLQFDYAGIMSGAGGYRISIAGRIRRRN